MKIILEVKEIALKTSELYVIDKYKSECIYLVTIETKKVYVLPNKKANFVLHIGDEIEVEHLFNEELPEFKEIEFNELDAPEPIDNVVTEAFALKMLAIVNSGTDINYKDIE